MKLRKLLLIPLVLASCLSARAQVAPIQATLNTVSTGACTPTSCLAYTIPSGVGSAGISVVGSSGTVVFEVFDMNGNYAPVNVTPSNSGTDVSSATVSGTQFFQASHIAGQYGFRVRLTASGSAAVTINPSTAPARATGGGSGGGVTSFSGDGTLITNSSSTGAVTATVASLSGTGSVCMTTNCAMTTPNLGTPSAVNLSNATAYTFPMTVAGTVNSGGIPCFSGATTEASSAAVTVNDAITGGGAGACAKDSGIPVYTGARAGVATNTAVGVGALASNGAATDANDTAFGASALNGVNGSGGSNTAVGQAAGTRVSSGSNNVMVGTAACNNTTTGTQQVCLGSNTQPNAAADTNEIVIGFNFSGAGSNTATIGNSSMTDHFVGSATGLAYENSAGFIDRGSTPTITGTGACATVTTQSGGATAGTFKCTGTTGASTITITFAKTTPNGWTCDVWDETTKADDPSQTSHSQTTCVLTSTTTVQNDVFVFKAFGW